MTQSSSSASVVGVGAGSGLVVGGVLGSSVWMGVSTTVSAVLVVGGVLGWSVCMGVSTMISVVLGELARAETSTATSWLVSGTDSASMRIEEAPFALPS